MSSSRINLIPSSHISNLVTLSTEGSRFHNIASFWLMMKFCIRVSILGQIISQLSFETQTSEWSNGRRKWSPNSKMRGHSSQRKTLAYFKRYCHWYRWGLFSTYRYKSKLLDYLQRPDISLPRFVKYLLWEKNSWTFRVVRNLTWVKPDRWNRPGSAEAPLRLGSRNRRRPPRGRLTHARSQGDLPRCSA